MTSLMEWLFASKRQIWNNPHYLAVLAWRLFAFLPTTFFEIAVCLTRMILLSVLKTRLWIDALSLLLICHFHDDVILLLGPESFRVCFLVQIRAFVIPSSLGLKNLKMKGKTKRILVVVVKWRHHANGLLIFKLMFSHFLFPLFIVLGYSYK